MNGSTSSNATFSPWPHRIAVLLVCVTFPLIWVGGLVTTYDAGMAVPDWPGTYGYNLFLYPLSTWISGPWDLFIEHGHRLLGSAAGLITIGLVIAIWRCDPRLWMRWLALGALGLVISQGLLGGIRVLAVDREIAKLHGCIGPAFFALCSVIAVLTSRRWHAFVAGDFPISLHSTSEAAANRLFRVAVVTTIFAYLQLFLGASLRHIAETAPPATYRMLVWMHLAVAALVFLHVLMTWLRSWRLQRALRQFEKTAGDLYQAIQRLRLFRLASFMVLVTCIQILLGCGTWVVKFGWPAMVGQTSLTAAYVPVEKSMTQANIITAHVAVGSLLLALSAVLAIRSLRLLPLAMRVTRSMWVASGARS